MSPSFDEQPAGEPDVEMLDESADGESVEVPASRRAALITLIVAAVIFAWTVYAAVGNVVQVPQLFGEYRDFVTKNGAPELAKTTPWSALIAALVVPVLGYLAGLRLGRGRALLKRIAIFVVMYAAVCALTVSLTGYVFEKSSLL
ncbi:hypothetical protein [Frondihabitans australicus]|uniref:Uncharacterized protein n=1 Tax=Frondihabitans australicus TaxID=386892 RepID=A0A495IDB5_9MICO|nr:hypothetical protein [Frondihabitans australicus]RKR73630.1 hypothetical protein C8E83_0723 [Frondihabitans australicus]